jgi:hypothetical protein
MSDARKSAPKKTQNGNAEKQVKLSRSYSHGFQAAPIGRHLKDAPRMNVTPIIMMKVRVPIIGHLSPGNNLRYSMSIDDFTRAFAAVYRRWDTSRY